MFEREKDYELFSFFSGPIFFFIIIMTTLEQAFEAERLQLSLICTLVRLRDLLAMATDLLATASFTNGTDPPYVQTKSTRNAKNERRKRWFSGWRRRALKSARDHEKREAAETVQAAERKQQQAAQRRAKVAQRRAKAAALDRKTAALKRRHREWIRKQINKRDRLLNQLMEKRAAKIRRKWRRQQHEEILQRAAERKRRRRERHNHNPMPDSSQEKMETRRTRRRAVTAHLEENLENPEKIIY